MLGSATQPEAEDESPLPELALGEQVPVAEYKLIDIRNGTESVGNRLI